MQHRNAASQRRAILLVAILLDFSLSLFGNYSGLQSQLKPTFCSPPPGRPDCSNFTLLGDGLTWPIFFNETFSQK
jgi:hypothetical protein